MEFKSSLEILSFNLMWNNCLKEPNFLEIILLKSLSFEIKTNPENCLTVICTGFKFTAFSDENRI